MKNFIFLSVYISISFSMTYGQNYTTHSQGNNNNAGGSYVAPIITKTYDFNSKGFQLPPRTSFSSYNYKASRNDVFSIKKTEGSTSDYQPLASIRQPKGRVYIGQNGKFGIEDGYGKKLCQPIYDIASDFSQWTNGTGLFWVKSNGKYGVLNPIENIFPIPMIYDDLKRLNSSYAMVKTEGKYGVIEINLDGNKSNIAIPIKYDDMGSIDEYDIWVKLDGKFGLISKDNFKHISIDYQDINVFSSKGYIVKKNGKMGIMNIRDQVVLPIEYDYITPLTNGVSWIYKNKKWGCINYKVDVLSKPQYDTVYEIKDGNIWLYNLAVVSKDSKRFYISTDGEELPFTDETITIAKTKSETIFEENFDEGNVKYI